MNAGLLATLAAALTLAACNRGPDVSLTNASGEEVAAAVDKAGGRNALRLQPGRWENRVELVSMDAPGMPPPALQMMRKTFAEMKPTASCLTPEEANRPAADFFTGGKGQNCSYERFSLGDGKLDSVMTCKADNAPVTRLEMAGTYAPDRFAATMTTRMTMPGLGTAQAGDMTMVMRINSSRTGDCKGDERA